MNLTLTAFGKYCDERRRENKRTIGMMADALGVDTAYISAVERGEILPPECYIENVAEFFGAKIEYVKAKVLQLSPVIDTSYVVTGRREIKWPENVVPFSDFKERRWPTISTSPTD